MKKWLIIILLLGIQIHSNAQTIVPDSLLFCGIKLHFTEASKRYIGSVIEKIKSGKNSFATTTERAKLCFPLIEECLKKCGVPDDLKYLSIQESSLRGDAVSPSKAVGYWQFKEVAAKEMGLTIDSFVDERKHLVKSTFAAANYFYKNNLYFDNYIYAITSYYTGGGGAIPYTDPSYYGAESMIIDTTLHWYPLKAIAHKLLYEPVLNKTDKQTFALKTIEFSKGGNLDSLISVLANDTLYFSTYNKWIKGKSLPENRHYLFVHYFQDSIVEQEFIEQDEEFEKPVPEEKVTDLIKPVFTYADLYKDNTFGSEYYLITDSLSQEGLSQKLNLNIKKIQKWNPRANELLVPGMVVRVSDPFRAHYHIYVNGESLTTISKLYGIQETRLIYLNRLKQGDSLTTGRKLYLRHLFPDSMLPVIVCPPGIKPIEKVVLVKRTNEDADSLQKKSDLALPQKYPLFPPIKSEWVIHTTTSGESIWNIAKKYKTRSDLILFLNNLKDNVIKEGMQLRIFYVTEDKKD